jgi:SAM-dependent methyltransferase
MTSSAAQKNDDVNYLKEVREHYENYPYPPMNPEDEKHRFIMPISEAFDCLNHYCYSGRRNFHKGFRALVAGGGTGDAIIGLAEQLRDSNTEVVYVDMSEASMKVAQQRAEKRGLTNIRWIHDSLLNIPKLGLGTFDYINCSGVLHHLADPDLGLKTLSDALNDDGAMAIMVYAQYGRMGVYIMQDILRRLNQDEPNLQQRVENAKIILNALPGSNWFANSSQMIINEIQGGDIAIYDLLLHSQDRAYTIPQLYEFVEKQKLNILQFFCDYPSIGHNLYNPEYYLNDPALIAKVKTWPTRERQALAELLHGKIEKHCFYAAKKVPPKPDPRDLEMIPLLGFDVFSEHDNIMQVLRMESESNIISFHQPNTNARIHVAKTANLIDIFAAIDGKRPLREIFREVMDANQTKKDKPNFQTLAEEFALFFESMHNANWLYLRHPSTAEVLHHDVFQARIPK